MPAAGDLRCGDEIQLLSGTWVRLTADARPSVGGRLVLEYESLEQLPSGMPTRVCAVTGVRADEEIESRRTETLRAA